MPRHSLGVPQRYNLAVALLGFASSPGNQAALKMARVTPRSESSRAAPSTTLRLLLCIPDGNPYGNSEKLLPQYSRTKRPHLFSKLIYFMAKNAGPPSVSVIHPTQSTECAPTTDEPARQRATGDSPEPREKPRSGRRWKDTRCLRGVAWNWNREFVAHGEGETTAVRVGLYSTNTGTNTRQSRVAGLS